MALKGMSTTLVIIVAAIVILVTALVVVTVFGGGMQNFLGFLNPWASETTALAQCQGICQQLCLTQPNANPPSGYREYDVTKDGVLTDCGAILPSCNCVDFRVGLGCGTYPDCAADCITDSATMTCHK